MAKKGPRRARPRAATRSALSNDKRRSPHARSAPSKSARPRVPTVTTAPDGSAAVESRIYEAIDDRRRRPWHNEEEVRVAWIGALETGLGIVFDAERGRKDGSYNNVIIEFKGPGLFRGSKSSPKFKEATEERLLPYIIAAADREGRPQKEYIGIAIDGEHICFARVSDDQITTGHLLPFSISSVGIVVAAILDSYRRAVTTDNLIEDFGHSSHAAATFMQALADALSKQLASGSKSKIEMLFKEWRTLYGQVADLSTEQTAEIDRALRFAWAGPPDDKMSGRLFVIHTYNSLLIKLLAAEIVSAHKLSSRTNPAEEMAALLDDTALLGRLDADIEHGDLFSLAGIKGFVEEALFSWYLDVCQDPAERAAIIAALRNILGKLSLYLTDNLGSARDVLRDFYQGLVPETLRKSLGEFYTPEWLVEYTTRQGLRGVDCLEGRFLDPTCGSGSFLVELIRLKRAAAKKQGLSPRDTVRNLCNTVWGFDLNPLAVQTARVNFLIAIADLLKAAPGQSLEVPVLRAIV